MNRSLYNKLYGLSRVSLIKWEADGTLVDRLAKMGIACYPYRVEEISSSINPARFDDLTRMPPVKLVEAEKEWLRTAYSYPGGPIMDPRPRRGAPKGVYYDEKRGKWLARPYITIPG